jgi:ABC-type lipoprotein release transport system permease subunit
MSGARGLWWRIAIRNLGRNPKRTVLAAAALGLGFAAAVLMVAVTDGMTAELIENGTGTLAGQIQIHAHGYLPARHPWVTIGGDSGVALGAVLDSLTAAPGVTGAAPRVYGGGLVSVGDRTEAAMLLGVDPRRERGVSRLLLSLTSGRPPAPGTRDAAIGSETARRLQARVGDTLVIVAPAADGSLGNDLFVISGVFHTGLAEFDAGMTVLPLGALQNLLALPPGRIHEVALAVRQPVAAPGVAARLTASPTVRRLDADVEPWTVFQPEVASFADLARSSNGLLVAIVFVVAIFGVANTLLMSTFERRREFAVEGALGVPRGAIARTVVYEGLVLGVVSLIAGAVVVGPILWWWHVAPLDLSGHLTGFTISGALVRPRLRAEPSVAEPLEAAVALLATSLLAAAWPAWRATRQSPADVLGGRA